jgi:ABC-type multidrug transport system fused ATPase/permease subunit
VPRRELRPRVAALMSKVGLLPRAMKKYPHEFSGGQRQRIAIARAVIRDTPILILDEPTVGLDAASEQAVIEAMTALMKGRTSMVIAHHLATIRHADVIFVIDNASVVEHGTHDELMKKKGAYAELFTIEAPEGAKIGAAQLAT